MSSILLVEDVAVVRKVLRRMLERDDHRVTDASDGNEALAALSQSHFDLIVTDIWMPGVDGIALITAARKSNAKIRIIAVTGGAPRAPQTFTAAEARAAGADDVLLKPVEPKELSQAVSRLLA